MDIELPILSAAMNLSGPRGMCFPRAIALCLDLPQSELIVAILRAATEEELRAIPNASPIPFFHAWVEWQGNLLAPTTIEQRGELVSMNPPQYYKVNGVRNIVRLNRHTVQSFCDDIIMGHLLQGLPAPHGYLVDRLFGAARIRYKTSEQGGVIPL